MPNLQVALSLGLAACLACFSCANGPRQATEPPSHTDAITVTGAPNSVPSALPAGSSSRASRAVPAPAADPAPRGTADSDPTESNAPIAQQTVIDPVPPLDDQDGNPLPQTEELPSLDSPSFKRRIELLFAAIQADDPELAASAFFPVSAYEQVKDVSQPGRDWKNRLMTAFARDIHEYHRQLGKNRAEAKLLGVENSKLEPRWMKPGTEGNKLGYHRLLRAKLKVADESGQERSFEITSMISWRGQWYIVHLHGFK